MKNRIAFFALILCILMTSCNWFQNLVDTSIKNITQNECGILVFKDSTHFLLVYNILEKQLEDYENSPAIQNNPDEEKPLTDFEILKSHSSYRKSILDQEQTAENNSIDLSVNPINEILEDDVILQTLLNKDRFLIIDGTAYYYYDDCTLYKFPVGLECQRTMPIAINFFEKLQTNPLEKAPFAYKKIDICNDEENYSPIRNGDPCQSISLEICTPQECTPQAVDFLITFPNLSQSIYTLIDPTPGGTCKYTINSTSTALDITTASSILNNSCGLSVGAYGFKVAYTFPSVNTTYHIKIEAQFSYTENNVAKTCTSVYETDYTVPPPCPIKESVSYNGTMVTINVSNPCNSLPGGFAFTPLDGNPSTNPSTSPPITPNSIVLEYSCSGEKNVKIDYLLNGCQNSKIIKVYPKRPGECCIQHREHRADELPGCASFDQAYKIKVILKEKNRKLTAVVKSFKKNSNNNKFKRINE